MSFETYYLNSLFDGNDPNKPPVQVCSLIRNSMVKLHNEGLDKLSNTSSCMLLDKRLHEYSASMNNKTTIDSLAGPIDSLLKGKIQTRHCSEWNFSLKSTPDEVIQTLKKNIITAGHCPMYKNSSCTADKISEDNLKDLLQNKRILRENDKPAKLQQPASSKKVILNKYEDQKPVHNTPSLSVNSKAMSENANSSGYSLKNNTNNISKPHANNFNTFSSKRPSPPYIEPKRPKITQNFNTNNNSAKLFNYDSNKQQPNVSQSTHGHRNESVSSNQTTPEPFFRTASAEHKIQNMKKYGNSKGNCQNIPENKKRSLGTTRSVQSKFIPPLACGNNMEPAEEKMDTETEQDERLKHIDPKMVELIMNEIIDSSAPIGWDDIAGLEFAKSAIQEAVVWPLLRPDIFTGLRRPPKGILLFGPPGTGKTLIGKCIASQCCATFFSISASSLTSKWIGDGEKMVRALFAVARCHQPAVVFIDEIDSLLTQRSDTEHEASRRIKTEFLVQLDGAATGDEDRLLVIGATNRPQELDEAARRRLVKRLYIPLPEIEARKQIINRLMSSERNSLTDTDVDEIAGLADGFSGADMRSLCSEAALGPIRAVPFTQITNIHSDQVRPVSCDDFKKALTRVRPSVSGNDLEHYIKWNKTYGSGSNNMSH